MFWNRKLSQFDLQVDNYLQWKAQRFKRDFDDERQYLFVFKKLATVDDVVDIRLEHVEFYSEYLHDQILSRYQSLRALKSLRGFLSYHYGRGYLSLNSVVVDPFIHRVQQ